MTKNGNRTVIFKVYELGGTEYIHRPIDRYVVQQRIKNTRMLYAKKRRLEEMVAEQVYERKKNSDMMVLCSP